MLLLSKRGFILYFVIFFIIIIFAFSLFFFNRIQNSGHSITREMGVVASKKLTEAGLSYVKKIVYENFSKGNYEFFENMAFPIKLDHDEGVVRIEKIEIVTDEEEEDIAYWYRGAQRGEKTYIKVTIKAESSNFRARLTREAIIEIVKVDFIEWIKKFLFLFL